MFGDGPAVCFAPYSCVVGFLGGISSGLTEADEPCEWLVTFSGRRIGLLTRRPPPNNNSRKDSFQFFLVRQPLPADHGHSHTPDSPS